MCVQEDELSSAECLGYRSLQQRLCGDDGPLRDLSAWRVTIPRVSSHVDPDNPRRTQLCYSIQVRRVDVMEGEFAPRRRALSFNSKDDSFCFFNFVQIANYMPILGCSL